ncbi:MAG: DDE-type integrase/transposase/recombinase [Silvibacterium sp.]
MLRYCPRGPRFAEGNRRLGLRLRELAEERRRWDYRRLHVLLKREGWTVNSKRVYRIYVEEKLMVCRRKRRRRICAQARVLLAAPIRVNETWTMDFPHDALASGRKVRTLSIEDAYTREMLAIEVDTSLPALRVVRLLEKLRVQRGLPVRIVIDHGTEFTSRVRDQWAYQHNVTLHFMTPGRPMENPYVAYCTPSDDCGKIRYEAAASSYRAEGEAGRDLQSCGEKSRQDFFRGATAPCAKCWTLVVSTNWGGGRGPAGIQQMYEASRILLETVASRPALRKLQPAVRHSAEMAQQRL